MQRIVSMTHEPIRALSAPIREGLHRGHTCIALPIPACVFSTSQIIYLQNFW